MTASPELHRTLYKLSHWEQPEEYTPPGTSGEKHWPVYTTDYLLKKLPLFITEQRTFNEVKYNLVLTPGGSNE